MFNQKINELSERGAKAKTHGEYLAAQIAIADIVSKGVTASTMPISGVSAAPVVMVLEQYARLIREAVGDDDLLDEEIAELQENTNTTEFRIQL